MTALDRLLQLQQQGLSESDIVNSLRQEGFPMKEIEDSLNQARIKNAVSQEPEQNNSEFQESQSNQNVPQQAYQEPPQNISGEYSAPQYAQPDYQTYPAQTDQQYQDYSGQQQYGAYYPDQSGGSTETITDIAEQIVNEKTHEILKKIDELTRVKNANQREIEELKERIKRIENSLDSIQRAIIGKIGEFGESTKMVQKDLENIHGTMSKMMNPLIDNYNELKKLNSKK